MRATILSSIRAISSADNPHGLKQDNVAALDDWMALSSLTRAATRFLSIILLVATGQVSSFPRPTIGRSRVWALGNTRVAGTLSVPVRSQARTTRDGSRRSPSNRGRQMLRSQRDHRIAIAGLLFESYGDDLLLAGQQSTRFNS